MLSQRGPAALLPSNSTWIKKNSGIYILNKIKKNKKSEKQITLHTLKEKRFLLTVGRRHGKKIVLNQQPNLFYTFSDPQVGRSLIR